jgi:HAD superfamily hydrolase (TIGR01484 family)
MGEQYLICTDLDRTLIPNGEPDEAPDAAGRFLALVADPNIRLAFVSGRHRELIEQAIEEYALPPPDFVIGDVGTSIYRVTQAGEWRLMEAWQSRIAGDWNGHECPDVLSWLDSVEELHAQEPDKQNRFKASFYHDAEIDTAALSKRVEALLEGRGVRPRLIWSRDDLSGEGLLDVLPARASKFGAIDALMAAEGIPASQVVFCGDSGNDLDVLVSPLRAVLVGNADEVVRREAVRRAARAGQAHRLFLARGNYRTGMLEGITYYFPELARAGQA